MEAQKKAAMPLFRYDVSSNNPPIPFRCENMHLKTIQPKLMPELNATNVAYGRSMESLILGIQTTFMNCHEDGGLWTIAPHVHPIAHNYTLLCGSVITTIHPLYGILTQKYMQEVVKGENEDQPKLLFMANPCPITGHVYSKSEWDALATVFEQFNITVCLDLTYFNKDGLAGVSYYSPRCSNLIKIRSPNQALGLKCTFTYAIFEEEWFASRCRQVLRMMGNYYDDHDKVFCWGISSTKLYFQQTWDAYRKAITAFRSALSKRTKLRFIQVQSGWRILVDFEAYRTSFASLSIHTHADLQQYLKHTFGIITPNMMYYGFIPQNLFIRFSLMNAARDEGRVDWSLMEEVVSILINWLEHFH